MIIPLTGVFIIITTGGLPFLQNSEDVSSSSKQDYDAKYIKITGLVSSIINLVVSLIVFTLFNFSTNQFQFVQEYYKINNFDIYLGVDGLSMYFVLLTTIIMPISLLSN